MARRRKKREAPISYRPPKKLREAFYTRALDSGLSVNAFITVSVFGKDAPRPRRDASLDRQIAAQLLSQASSIKDGLPALPHNAPAAQVELLMACHRELAEIRAALMLALGREP